MSADVGYLIDGRACSGLEYLELIEDVFSRDDADVSYVELQNGEGISLGGCSYCVSILHHRNDGTIWSPNEEVTKELVISLTKAFIEGDSEVLSAYGASLLPPEARDRVDISESGRIQRVLGKLFSLFFAIGLSVTIIWGVSDAPNTLVAFAFLCLALALLAFTFAGLVGIIDTYRCVSRSMTTPSRLKQAGAYLLLACGLLLMLLLFVIVPLYIVVFIVLQIGKLL